MFNVICMDLYHMFRTKCFWIMMLVTVGFLFIVGNSISELAEQPAYTEEELMQIKEEEGEEEYEVVRGMMDMSLENIVNYQVLAGKSGQTITVLVCLFAVLFSMRERKNGFIKNIAGGMKHRWYLWVSKIVVMTVYILITFFLTLFCLAISEKIFGIGGDMTLDAGFWKVFGLLGVLYLILSMFCITIVNLSRSLVISVLTAFFAATGMVAMFLMIPGEILKMENLIFHQYTAEFYILQMNGMPQGDMMQKVLMVIFGGIVFYNMVNIFLLKKRDVC